MLTSNETLGPLDDHLLHLHAVSHSPSSLSLSLKALALSIFLKLSSGDSPNNLAHEHPLGGRKTTFFFVSECDSTLETFDELRWAENRIET